jgi:drug/metabolite transporter (DMT)-like permease
MNILGAKSIGVLAALLTVTIWAMFLLLTRFAVVGDFTVEEVLVLRIVPGAIFLSPLLFKFDLLPKGISWPRLIILMIGTSAVFPYIVSNGLAYASASDAGVLAPGILPFWAALAAYFLTGEKVSGLSKIGLCMILSGALLVGLWQVLFGASEGAWKGHLMFLTGSGLFAIYSVVFRQSGLTPMHSLIIGLFWGTIIVVPILVASGRVSFSNIEFMDIFIMIILQSFISGILATILFTYGVQLLGAAQVGAFGALTPILTLLGGVILLDELVTPVKIFGVILVAIGVFLASGILVEAKTNLKSE